MSALVMQCSLASSYSSSINSNRKREQQQTSSSKSKSNSKSLLLVKSSSETSSTAVRRNRRKSTTTTTNALKYEQENNNNVKKIFSGATALSLSFSLLTASLTFTNSNTAAEASSLLLVENPALSELAGLQANPVTNARALLRNALPIDCKEIRQIQKALETISDDLRVPGVKFSGVEDSVNKSLRVVKNEGDKIVDKAKTTAAKDAVKGYLKSLQTELEDFQTIVANKDKQEVPIAQQKCLSLVTKIEEALVSEFPYKVPAPYNTTLPRLEGRATVEMQVKIKDNAVTNGGKLTIVLDGYNAPVSAGNFTDLIQKKFYDGMKIQRSDGFVVQSGKPENAPKGVDGYIDPATGKERSVPLEIMPESSFMKKKAPEYDFTFEENGMYREQPVLPFNAFGTLAMARREADNNSASSQFFFLLRESELTPSGTNILDGRYSIFGYVVDNQELLRDLKVDDEIVSMKVVKGSENLVKNEQAAPPSSVTNNESVSSDE